MTMKWMIASDIHGSAYYAEKMMKRYEEEKAEKLFLLGDILYHGPRNDLPEDYAPKKVIALLNPKKKEIVSVRGNCEAEVDQMVLEFPVLSDSMLLSDGTHTFFLTHGHLYTRAQLSQFLSPGNIVISGHTHIPLHEEENGILYLNPGSVSIPKENTPHSYMIFEDGILTWKDLDGVPYDQITLK